MRSKPCSMARDTSLSTKNSISCKLRAVEHAWSATCRPAEYQGMTYQKYGEQDVHSALLDNRAGVSVGDRIDLYRYKCENITQADLDEGIRIEGRQLGIASMAIGYYGGVAFNSSYMTTNNR